MFLSGYNQLERMLDICEIAECRLLVVVACLLLLHVHTGY